MATTSMDAFVTEVSKQMNDWWEGTADTNATNPTYTLVDTALAEKQATWVSSGASGDDASYLYIKTDAGGASAAPEGEERIINSDITVATGTILVSDVYPFSAAIAQDDTYEIHRMFSRGEKERAIVYACNKALPQVYKEVQDRSFVFGDWLINGGNFPKWSQTTYPDDWTLTTATVSRNTTEAYIFGLPTENSLKFDSSGSAGNLAQSHANVNDLWMLAGKTVTFYAWVYTSGANEITLSIADGTDTTYGNHSSHTSTSAVYHPGDSTWRLMYATATIADNPSEVTFKITYATASADAYVSRVHAIAGGKYEYDISSYDLYQNIPSQIFRLVGSDASDSTPEANPRKVLVDGYNLTPNGKLSFFKNYKDGTRFEINGMGYLTAPVSTYDGGTATSTEVNSVYQEGQIIVGEAIQKLFQDKLHSSPIKDIERYQFLVDYWDKEVERRRSKYAMKAMPITRSGA